MEIEEFKNEIESMKLNGVEDIPFLFEFTNILADKIIDDWFIQIEEVLE